MICWSCKITFLLDGLETTNVGGDPHDGAPIIPTAIVEFTFDHITVENQVVSKFWAYPIEMEEHANGKHLRGLVNLKKLQWQFSLERRNEGLFIFLEC